MSDNTKLPAYPLPLVQNEAKEIVDSSVWCGSVGFTKLELASLMITQGYIASGAYKNDEQEGLEIAKCSVNIAKAVLEEANK